MFRQFTDIILSVSAFVVNILLVEDDLVAGGSLREWMESAGFAVDYAASGEEALQVLNDKSFAVIILDWELPGISGYDVLQNCRKSGITTPVIFLTGRNSVLDKLKALDMGADDYVVKPVNPVELSARIRSKLRRGDHFLPSIISLGNVKLDTLQSRLTIDGKVARLSNREYAVLEYLMRHMDRAFSSEELLTAVWASDADATENSVRQIVFSLRRKLETDGAGDLVCTVPGKGYVVESSYEQPET